MIRVHKLSTLPANLLAILQSTSVVFAGRNIGGDVRRIQAAFNIVIPNYCDVGTLCKEKGLTEKASSLKYLTERILGYTLCKEEQISDWNRSTLSASQLAYAARDALASYLLYKSASSFKPYSTFNTVNDTSVPFGYDTVRSVVHVDNVADIYPTESPATPMSGESLAHTRVLLDSFHAMKRITDTIPRQHTYRWVFCRWLRDAMFLLNPTDVENVKRILKKQFIHLMS